MGGLPDRPALPRRRREAVLRRLPPADQREEAAAAASGSGAACGSGPASAPCSSSAYRAARQSNDGARLSTNSSGYFTVNRSSKSATYRFTAYSDAVHQPGDRHEPRGEAEEVRGRAPDVPSQEDPAPRHARRARRSAARPHRRDGVQGAVVGVRGPHGARPVVGRRSAIQHLNEVKDLGVDTLRIEVKWNEVAPEPELEDEAEVRRLGPDRLREPPERLPGLRAATTTCDPARQRAGLPDHHHDHRRRPALGDGRRQRHGRERQPPPQRGRVRATSRPRWRSATPASTPACRRSSTSRSGTSPTTASSSSRPRARPASTATWSTRRSRRSGAVNKNAKIFIGETAPVGRAPKAMGPKEFFRKWLCLNNRFKRTLDGHRLPQLQEDRRRRLRAPPLRPDRARAEDARRDQHARDPPARRLPRQGRGAPAGIPRNLPIYNTEFGLQSNPPDRLVSTTPVRQAALINEKEEYSYRYGRLKSYSQYLLFDDPPRKGPLSVKWSGFQTGLAIHEREEEARLHRLQVPDRGARSAAVAACRSGAGCGPGTGQALRPAPAQGRRQLRARGSRPTRRATSR